MTQAVSHLHLAPAPGLPPTIEPLTAAEVRVLAWLPTHLSLQQIADELVVSRNTVKCQAAAIYRKLGAAGRDEAVRYARATGLLAAAADGVGHASTRTRIKSPLRVVHPDGAGEAGDRERRRLLPIEALRQVEEAEERTRILVHESRGVIASGREAAATARQRIARVHAAQPDRLRRATQLVLLASRLR
jgi:DNA-binding CsgD family transcriptional regulator